VLRRAALCVLLAACGSSATGPDGGSDSSDAAPDAATTIDASPFPLAGFGSITGACDELDVELTSAQPSVFVDHLDFAAEYMDADLSQLTTGGQKIIADGNAGGSSLMSEVFAYEVLARCELAALLKTELEIDYDDVGTITDLLVEIDGYKIGVSVTRAVAFPFEDPYTAAQADAAKLAVAGYTAEDEFARAARNTLGILKETVGVHASDVVLEIGAGVGRVGALLAPLCKKWIGADVSENMVAHTRKRLAAHPNVDTVAVNGWDLAPIPSSSVDLVYCTVVFMHLDEWERFSYVREAFRVLRPGGRLYVDNVNLLSDEGWAFFVSHLEDFHPLERPPNISKTSTPEELRAYFQRAGFTEIDAKREGLWVATFGKKPGATT
jgi:SAM-dependent methyltransferase